MDEFEWIESISRFQAPGGRGGLIMGIGDDCAVFEGPAGRWLLFASDMLAAGVHFPEGEEADLADVGWKAASVNMSDVAAMGGRPLFAAVSVAVPGNMEPRRLWPLYEGMRLAFEAEGAGIIGGDTVRAAGGLTVNVAIIGEVEKDGAVLRHGAAAGDALWVTGPLGDAYAGLRLLQKPELEVAPQLRRRALEAQLRPRARVGLGRALRTAARAMLDISDGLAGDLTICAGRAEWAPGSRPSRSPWGPPVKRRRRRAGRTPYSGPWAAARTSSCCSRRPPTGAAH